MRKLGLLTFILLLVSSCQEDDNLEGTDIFQLEIPSGFPDIPFPQDNSYTYDRWLLGKELFFDTRLSKDNNVSCASCHQTQLAFSDDVAFSLGSEGGIGTRNAPTLANVAYHPYYLREGGLPTLEMQVLVPIQEHNEFNSNIVTIAEELSKDESYQYLSSNAYDREIDPYVITRAISTFERTLVSGNSRYDQYENGENLDVLNESEINGMNLFFSSKTDCAQCHGGFNFTNYAFENNGLYLEYADNGRARLTFEEDDVALFKTPTLRNIELTAPYMHDGSIATLEEVIEHYNQGGKAHPHKNHLIRPLNLTAQEKSDLVKFLETLTDHSFIQNRHFQK